MVIYIFNTDNNKFGNIKSRTSLRGWSERRQEETDLIHTGGAGGKVDIIIIKYFCWSRKFY